MHSIFLVKKSGFLKFLLIQIMVVISVSPGVAGSGGAQEQFDLGVSYALGRGVAKNEEKAVYWYRKAAEQGHPRAQYNLGCYYDLGEGSLPQDKKMAAYWYKQAALQGHLDAMNNYAVLVWQGNGVEKNCQEAVQFFQRAAESNYSKAQDNLGQMIYLKECLEHDAAEAVRLVTKAAMQGDEHAQTRLGSWYAAGDIVAKNHGEALFWSLLGARQGIEFAKNTAESSKNNLNGSQISNVNQRVASFKPRIDRPTQFVFEVQEFSIRPNPVSPEKKFDFIFRFHTLLPKFVDDKEMNVEFHYSINQVGESSPLLTSEPVTMRAKNNRSSAIIKGLKASSRTGEYELVLYVKYFDSQEKVFRKKFTII